MNRKFKNAALISCFRVATLFCFVVLFLLFSVVFLYGVRALNVEFLTTGVENFGAKGGVLFNITGSLILLMGATLVSLPVSLGTAVFKSEYISNKNIQKISDVLIMLLNGIPSVIYGLFGLVFFVHYLDFGISWIVGSMILGIMIIPTIILSTYHAVKSIPVIYRESALGLGLTKWNIVRSIILPKALQGGITGLLLGLSRAIGESAPIMFTATVFSGIEIPSSMLEPVVALPTHILYLTQQAVNPDAIKNAWGASFILLLIVLLFNLISLLLRRRAQKFNAYA